MSEDYPCLKKAGLTIYCTMDGADIKIVVQDEDDFHHCTLAPNIFELQQIIVDLTNQLDQIVDTPEYRNQIEIDPGTCQQDLNRIARLNLFDKIFLGFRKRHDSDNKKCVNIIKRALKKPTKVSINTREVFLPWALFYDGDIGKIVKGEKAKPESFWGFKHLIEQKVENNNGTFGNGNDFAIRTTEYLLSCFLNRELDQQCIEEHDGIFSNMKNPFCTKIGTKKQDVIDAFEGDEERPYSFIYFYCHAKTGLAMDGNDSHILLTDHDPLTASDLQASAISTNFVKEPLVFINACESGAISPLFYRGFTPYFFVKGSKHIIGTLSSIPAKFASSFGISFLQRYLKQEKAGITLFELKNEYLLKYNNLVGLYYVSYGPSNHHLAGTKSN